MTGPLIRPITIAKKEFMLLKLLQLQRERELINDTALQFLSDSLSSHLDELFDESYSFDELLFSAHLRHDPELHL